MEIDKSMKPGGILMFTAHGPISAAKIEIYGPLWVDKHEEIRDALDKVWPEVVGMTE